MTNNCKQKMNLKYLYQFYLQYICEATLLQQFNKYEELAVTYYAHQTVTCYYTCLALGGNYGYTLKVQTCSPRISIDEDNREETVNNN